MSPHNTRLLVLMAIYSVLLYKHQSLEKIESLSKNT